MPGQDFPRESGPVAFISQSGGHAIRFPRRASGWGIRFSKVASYGNACDVNECDLLEYLSEDPETKIITGYLEGVKDGPRFFHLLQEVTKSKPVILLKGGLTRGGARAVQSHTGSLGGEEAVWDALFKQSGTIRVSSPEELLDTTLAFLHLAPLRGRRICAVGGGGAITVGAADAFERVGLSVPLFPAELQKKLLSVMPSVGTSARNPVDVGNPFPSAASLRIVLETLLNDGNVDAVVIDELEMAIASPSMKKSNDQFLRNHEEMTRVPVEVKKSLDKPVVMVLPVEATGADVLEHEGDRRNIRNYYLNEGIPVYLTLDRAARALANLIGYYEHHDAALDEGKEEDELHSFSQTSA